MKKNRNWRWSIPSIRKLLRVMKLSIFLMVAFSLQLSATTKGQEINLKAKGMSIRNVLKEIKRQTGYYIMFNESDIDRSIKVDHDITDLPVNEALELVFEKLPLQFNIVDDYILIKKRQEVVQQQQDFKVKGLVTDDNGEPVPGVNIIVHGYNTGTITQVDGSYEINVPEKDVTLIFTFIGFKKATVAVSGRSEIDVQLMTEVSELGDVVVTGFGKRNKESYTGAAITVEGDELRTVSNSNILTSLQVLDPSFVMVENIDAGSNPNVVPEFEVRGSASIPGLEDEYKTSPNMPTFILDGFQVSASVVFDLDPYRVKSITILKDASATAIYGSRGANGVVVIETNAPKAGKIQVSYNMGLTINAPDLSDYDLLNAKEKLDLEVAAGYYPHESKGDEPVEAIEARIREYNAKLKMLEQGHNTYWLSQPLESGVSHQHSLLLEGGDKVFRYGVDVNFNQNDGVMKESGRDRYGMGIKLQYMVDNFTFQNKLTYENVLSRNSPYGSFSTYARLNPYYSPYNELGDLAYELRGEEIDNYEYNPMYNSTLNVVDETASKRFINNFSIDWQINPSSLLRGSFSLTQQTNRSDYFRPAAHTDFAHYQGDDVFRRGMYSLSGGESNGYEGKLVYTYTKSFDKNMFYVNLGGNIQQSVVENYTVTAEGFPNEHANTIQFAKQYLEDGRPFGSEYTSRLLGTLGSFNYTYDNRYFADVSFRFDGSSRFGAESRWAPFGSAGLGWNMHNEQFLKDIGQINRLRIRASHGLTGSQEYDPYQAMVTYQYYNDTRYHFGYGATMKALGNVDLKWQRTLMSNIGFDGDFFNNRITLSGNFYLNLSKDVLTPVTLPTSLGFTTYMENMGEVENKGFEGRFNAFIIKNKEKRFNWSVSGSAIHNVNKLKKLSNSLKAINDAQDKKYDSDAKQDENGKNIIRNKPAFRFIEGESTNTIWAVRSLGIDPATGNEVYLTRNGEKTFEWNSRDIAAVGVTDPVIRGSLGSNFTVNRFQLSVFFMYRIGGQTYNQTLVDRVENADKHYNVDRRVLDERWKQPGDLTFYKRIDDHTQTKPTSRFVEDYSYINFSSLNLSYEFNREKLEKIGFKRLKALFYMNDIFRSSTVKEERGLSYPFARSFTFTLQAQI